MSTNTEQVKEIRDELISAKDAPLYEYRTENNYFPVIGEGNHDAEIMFVGEAPGKNEAKTGRPFCGAAGKLLDELLESIKIDRKSVYITNIVKDRPQNNRDPLPEEIDFYAPFLDRQIKIIKPKVIATLGRFSGVYILEKFGLSSDIAPMANIHGKVFESEGIKIVPLYHPAAAIYNRGLKDTLLEDFKVLKDL